MADPNDNPLVSIKPSDAPVLVSLHPLVLLTASDLITRHRVRNEQGPLAGLILGQQNGRDTTAEHAFPAKLVRIPGIDDWVFDEEWLSIRIQQCKATPPVLSSTFTDIIIVKDVHKAPALDVVGWFSICPDSGPLPAHLLNQKVVMRINDNAVFLGIHAAALNSADTTNRKLPISIYEGVVEGETAAEGEVMQIDGDDLTNLKFRELPYIIETDETEMIAIDYVAKGAGSAVAVQGTSPAESRTGNTDAKGKQRADGKSEKKTKENVFKADELTTEEEDQIASITTRLNSVKMLQSRLQVLSSFVQSLPRSYASDASVPLTETSPGPEHLSHLRAIQALLARLSLLTPSATPDGGDNAVQNAAQTQKNDVALTTMLAQLGHNVQGLEELGKKFVVVETAKGLRTKSKGGFGAGSHGGLDEHDAKVGGFTMSQGLLV